MRIKQTKRAPSEVPLMQWQKAGAKKAAARAPTVPVHGGGVTKSKLAARLAALQPPSTIVPISVAATHAMRALLAATETKLVPRNASFKGNADLSAIIESHMVARGIRPGFFEQFDADDNDAPVLMKKLTDIYPDLKVSWYAAPKGWTKGILVTRGAAPTFDPFDCDDVTMGTFLGYAVPMDLKMSNRGGALPSISLSYEASEKAGIAGLMAQVFPTTYDEATARSHFAPVIAEMRALALPVCISIRRFRG